MLRFTAWKQCSKHALLNRSYSAIAQRNKDSEAESLFESPSKEFSRFVNQYHTGHKRDNSAIGFVYKDRVWNLYRKLDSDYKFSDTELRIVLRLLPFASVDEEIRVERVQEVISKMISLGYNPGGDGLNALIAAYGSLPHAIDKIDALLYSWKHSPPQTKRVYNQLLCVYGKIHGAEVAEKWFDSLVGTMLYSEVTEKSKGLKPLIKDGGVYCHLIKMYCQEENLNMAIQKFKQMSKRFDQSNRTGAIGRIMNLLNKKKKHYEVLAWYTSSKMNYMFLDETSFFKVIKAVLFFSFSRNAFIPAKELIKLLAIFGTKWKLNKNEQIESIIVHQPEIESLVTSLKIEDPENQDQWCFSKENCLNFDSSQQESMDNNPSEAKKVETVDGTDYLKEIKDIFQSYNTNKKYVMQSEAMPQNYDESWLAKEPKNILESVFSDMVKKDVSPTLLTFNAIIYSYYKMEAYHHCAMIYEYTKTRLDTFCDASTISIMTKVYTKLGQYSKSQSMNFLTDQEIIEGDSILVGSQLDLMLTTGKHLKLKQIFDTVDDFRELGSRNITVALRMYLKEYKMDEAKKLFERIISAQIEEGKFNAIPFNIMLQSYSRNGDMDSFIELVKRMNDYGISFGEDTFVAIMRAYSTMNQCETALEYYRKMIAAGIEQTLLSYHCIIDIFTKNNNEVGIKDMIKSMIEKNVVPNEHIMGTLVQYYVNFGRIKQAREIQDLFRKSFSHISSNIRCHNSIISHYSSLQDRQGVLDEVRRATTVYNARLDIESYILMIKAFAPGDIVGARKIFDLALDKCSDNLIERIFTTMMEAYYQIDDYESMKVIYTKMEALEVPCGQKIVDLMSLIGA